MKEYKVGDIIKIGNSAGVAELQITEILKAQDVNRGKVDILEHNNGGTRVELYSWSYGGGNLILISEEGQDNNLYGMIYTAFDERIDFLCKVKASEEQVFMLVE